VAKEREEVRDLIMRDLLARIFKKPEPIGLGEGNSSA